jgi:uncharacterized protein involved in exopolysaccharide biosynthesis
MTEQNTLTEIVRIFFRWRKLLLIVTLITAVGSAIVAFLLPNYYKSTEIFYPYNLEYLDPKNIMVEEVTDKFGTNADVERLKQIGLSSQLTEHMVKKFNLYKRYDIDLSSPYASYDVGKEFSSNYSIIKNDNGALEVTIYDQDKAEAAKMASEAVHFIDSINKQALLDNNVKMYWIFRNALEEKYKELEAVEGSVQNIENNKEKEFKGMTPKVMIESGKINEINAKLIEKLTQAIELKEKHSQAKAFLEANFNTIFVIEKAVPAIKKSRPFRTLIVAASCFLAFFLTLFIVLLIEFYRNTLREIIRDVK